MKLYPKFLIALAITVGLMLLSVFYIIWQADKALVERQKASFARESRLLIDEVDRMLFERFHNVQTFSLSLGDIEPGKLAYISTSPEMIAKLNSLVVNYQAYRRIAIFDTDGSLLAANSRNAQGRTLQGIFIPKQKVAASAWFQQILNNEDVKPGEVATSPVVAGPYRYILSPNPDHYDLIFGSRILDTEGNIAGVWVNIVDLASIESIFESHYALLAAKGMEDTQLVLIDKDGKLLIDFAPLQQGSPEYHRSFDRIDAVNLKSQGMEAARLAVSGLSGNVVEGATNQELVVGFARSKGAHDFTGLGWSSLISMPKSAAFRQSERIKTSATSFALVLVSLTMAGGGLVCWRLSRSFNSLSDTMDQLALGNSQVELPNIRRSDEIGNMARSLGNLQQVLIERDRLREQNEQQLFWLEIQKRATDSSSIGIWVSDISKAEHPIVYTNRAFETLSGYSSADIIGCSTTLLNGPGTEPEALSEIDNAIAAGNPVSVTLTHYKKGAQPFTNKLRLDPVYSSEGALTHYIAFHEDVTEALAKAQQDRQALETEIEQRTKEARSAANRLQAVWETAPDGMVIFSPEGQIMDVNRAFEKLFGLKRDELFGSTITALFTLRASQGIESISVKDIAYEFAASDAFDGLHFHKRRFPVELAIAEVYTEDLHAYLAVVKDQTEHQQRKASERFLRHALEERELIYRTAFGQAAMGIARISLEGQFIEVNMKLCQLFGYPEKAFLRLNYADISLDKDNAAQQLWQRLKEGQIDNFSDDLEFVTRRGETFWANLAVSLVSTDTGEAKYFIAIFEDITSRKASEQKLQDSKQQIDELLRGMQVASDAGGICNWSLDLVTGEVKWDEGSFALFGYSPDETASYELWKRAVHPDDIANAEQGLSMAIQDGSDYHAEYRAYCQSTGELRWVKSAGSVVTNEDNQALVIHGINLDISEEREIQAKLAQESQAAQQANKAKSQFLATMSHEIRTPMNGIIGMVDLLKDTSLSDDQTRMVQTVKDSSYALLDIINDILDFSKIESGQMELEILNISILSTVEKMIDTVWINANRKGVRLCVRALTEIPDELQLDPVRVRQILLNLVGNAIKFTSGEQQHDCVSIILGYDKTRGLLNMRIEDTGIGMNQTQIGSLFKPFTQADSSTTRQYGGTGLGLSITKSFVELMGGAVTVSSEAGNGSCFTVEIPSSPPAEFVDVFSKYDISNYSIVLMIKDPLHARVCRDLAERLGPREILDTLPEDSLENLNQVVVITDSDDDNISMFGWRMLLLNEDPLSEHGSMTPTYYVVGAHPLKPSDLMFGIAVLCGLDSAELHALSNVIDLDHVPALADREQAERQGRVILCAEDQPTNRLVLSKQLDKLGYCYDMAEDGLEALELWTRHQHKVVLTDCHMPKMDGFELTKAIRQIEKPQNRPTIIAITANALTGESENCRNAGMDDYLSKPVDLKALQKCLSNHFKDLGDSLEPPTIAEQPDGITVEGIDNEHLYRVLGCDDEELAKSVLAMFWTSLESDQQRLNEAVGSADFNSIRSIAHGAKGATASSGALELSELFKQIEHQYQDIDTVNKILVNIDLLANKIGDSLRQSHIV